MDEPKPTQEQSTGLEPDSASAPEVTSGGSSRWLGRDQQCVAALQSLGMPHTSVWRPGGSVREQLLALAPNTPIATFSNGRYTNSTDGTSHAALFQRPASDGSGFYVLDQWKGKPFGERFIPFDNKARPVNNGENYQVVSTGDSGPTAPMVSDSAPKQTLATNLPQTGNQVLPPDLTRVFENALTGDSTTKDSLVANLLGGQVPQESSRDRLAQWLGLVAKSQQGNQLALANIVQRPQAGMSAGTAGVPNLAGYRVLPVDHDPFARSV